MEKHAWILMGLSLVACMALAGCANAAPTDTPPPTRTSAPTATPTAPPNTPAPTATPAAAQPLTLVVEDLVGIWRTGDSFYQWIELKADGTLAVSGSLPGLRAGMADMEGQFTVERDELSVKDNWCGDVVAVFRLESKAEGKLTFERVKDDCGYAPDVMYSRWAVFSALERVQ